jgi:hypothetical protein
MIVTNCPRCDEEFRIPDGEIPSDAYAHCPWCRETFPFSDVLGNLPPTLQLLDSDGRPLEISEARSEEAAGLQIVGSQKADPVSGHLVQDNYHKGFTFEGSDSADPHATVADKPLDETIVDDDWNQQVDLTDSSTHVETFADDDSYDTLEESDASPLQSVSVSGNRGPRKRKGSGIGTLIGIVLGGLLSLPIAGGLLTLLGKTPDWGFWPFLGETDDASGRVAAPPPQRSVSDVGGFDPGTRPSLRFNQESAGTQSSYDPAEEAAREIVGTTTGEPMTAPSDANGDPGSVGFESMSEDRADDTTSFASSTRHPAGSEEIDAASASPPDAANTASAESIDPEQVALDDEAPASSPPSPPSANADQSVASPPTLGDNAASAAQGEFTPEELANRAVQMIRVVSSTQLGAGATPQAQTEQRRRIALTYQTIAGAAAGTDSPGDALKALAATIVSSPLCEDVRAAGWQWLKSPNRQSSGIALIGLATEGGTVLESDSGETIALLGDTEIPDGDQVLVLGRLDQSGESLRVIHTEPVR